MSQRVSLYSTPIAFFGSLLVLGGPAVATQETDVTQTPNAANAGIKKSFVEEIGAGRGDVLTPDSSLFIINRDPARAIVRGRQLFQRKFTDAQGLGPRTNDGIGDIQTDLSHGAGLADSCAACHGRPQGSAGFGGDVFTRPSSRDAPHLFGLGLVEMLGDEITQELRGIRDDAISDATTGGTAIVASLDSKGINYGLITANPDGSVDTSQVTGVDLDLRVRPFFAQGGTISIREFLVGAFNAEMGLESPDPDLLAAAGGADILSPSGINLSGSLDAIEGPPASSVFEDPDADGVLNEIPESVVDFMEFYLLNYFKPAVISTGLVSQISGADPVSNGRRLMQHIGCTACHIQDLQIDVDRRVADVETVYDVSNGNPYNGLFATATTLFTEVDDGSGFPTLKVPNQAPFLVQDIFADFKRHDLGPNFYEKNFDDSIQREFLTEPLWGVGTTGPYGHDGRSPTLRDVILRHGGEAATQRDSFTALSPRQQDNIIDFLESLIIFPPPATASNLNPANPLAVDYPLNGHGSIDLGVLFNDPLDKE